MKQRTSLVGSHYPQTNSGSTGRGVFVLFLVILGVCALMFAACEQLSTSITYTVVFDKNNASATGSMENQTFTYGIAQKFTTCGFSSRYHAFTGWNTKADGSGTMYFNGQNGSKVTLTQDGMVPLYAQWSLNTADLSTYINNNNNPGTENNPLDVGLNRQLTTANWNAIMTNLGSSKYISLDLSACTRSSESTGRGLHADGVLDPSSDNSTSKARIVNITLPAGVTGISAKAFEGYSALKSITLGATPPKLGIDICSGLSARTIRVKIPESAQEAYGVSSYDNDASSANNWGNGFRGWGWGGTASQSGTVNTSITLVFETY